MKSRREALGILSRFIFTVTGILGAVAASTRSLYAAVKKRILPKETDPGMLSDENPEYLDTRNLKITPMESFGTMGDVDQTIDRHQWRLEVGGGGNKRLQLSYDDVLNLPAIHKKVLLICPGFFSYHAEWTGISIQELLRRSGVPAGSVQKVHIRGQSKRGEKSEVFSIAEVNSDAIFLAYAVNGKTLPQKHGFPLRVVADGHWGAEWIKYVTGLEFA